MVNPSLIITLHGSNVARCEGHEVKARGMAGPICSLAREMVDRGYDPNRPVRVYRGDTVCFSTVSLGWWAKKQCRESKELEPKFYKYQEFWGAA